MNQLLHVHCAAVAAAAMFGVVVADAAAQRTMSSSASSSLWWDGHAGIDCSSSTVFDTPNRFGSILGNMSVGECQQQCLDTIGCTAVTVDVETVDWVVHRGTNCYSGHGARDLVDGDGTVSDCFTMALQQCRSQCLLIPGCTGWWCLRGLSNTPPVRACSLLYVQYRGR